MPPRHSRSVRKSIAAGLLGSFSLLIFGYLWWGRFEYFDERYLAATYTGCILAVAIGHLYFRDTPKRLGLRLDNLGKGLWTGLVATALLAIAILALAAATGRLQSNGHQIPWVYIPWAFLQQYLLQGFLLSRFRNLFSNRWAVVAASLLFALFHLPNWPLLAMSFLGGLAWTSIFLRVPNLLSVAISHAALGLLLSFFFKFDGLNKFRVGPPGHPYAIFGDGAVVAAGYDALGAPVIATLPGSDRGNRPQVRLFTPHGRLLRQWNAFPEYGYGGNFAMGDLGFGSGDEVAVAPGPGVRNPPEVRVFDLDGQELSRFRLKGHDGYGAFVSIGQGLLWVSPGPGPARQAECFAYRPDGTLVRHWSLGDLGFENSVRCAPFPDAAASSAPKDPDGLEAAGSTAEPPKEESSQDESAKDDALPPKPLPSRFMAWPTFVSVNPSQVHFFDADGQPLETWRAFPNVYGMNLTPIRFGADAFGIVTAPGPILGHTAAIRVLDADGRQSADFIAYRENWECGSNLASVDVDGDGRDEIVLGGGDCSGVPPDVRIVDLQGNTLYRWKGERD